MWSSRLLVFLPRIRRKDRELRPHHAVRHVEHRENRLRDVLAEQFIRIVAAGLAVEVGLYFGRTHARDANAVRPELGLPGLGNPAHGPFARTVNGAAGATF